MTLEELIDSGRITENELRALWQRDVTAWAADGHAEGGASFETWLSASGWLDD